LYTLNNLTEESVIIPGQKLTIRLPGTGASPTPGEATSAAPSTAPTRTPSPSITPSETSPVSQGQSRSTTGYPSAESAPTREGGVNWARLFIRYDPVLGIIILFMASGVTLIVIGKLLRKPGK
jgi:hypothetical protein